MTTITGGASGEAARRARVDQVVSVKDVGDQPDEDEPKRGADQQADQEAANRTERIIPGVTTGRWHSLRGVPLRPSLARIAYFQCAYSVSRPSWHSADCRGGTAGWPWAWFSGRSAWGARDMADRDSIRRSAPRGRVLRLSPRRLGWDGAPRHRAMADVGVVALG